MHLAVLFHRFGPYHWARLSAAAHCIRVSGVEVAGHTKDYAWERVDGCGAFKRLTLFPHRASTDVSAVDLKRRVHGALSSLRPDVVAVHGWSLPSALAATQWCLRHQTPAVLMSDSTEYDARRMRGREYVKRRIVRLHGAALVAGMPHVDYLIQLGLLPEHIFTGYDAVDNVHFAEGSAAARESAGAVRVAHGLPTRYFLASARFIPKKNLPRLLEAYAHYRSEAGADAWDLVLLGDGPLKSSILRRRRDLRLQEAVHLPGFKQYDELPAYYGLAGAFVHASTTEQWGLVVNEAMAAGLPVIVSERCGCAPDLIEDGRNGFTFDPHDAKALAKLMLRVSNGTCDRAAMGKASREVISRWTPEVFANNLLRAARAAQEVPPPSQSFVDDLLLEALMRR